MQWTRALALEKLDASKPTLFRHGPKQIAIWKQQDQIFAFDNRCPHEGYPLREGQVNANCVLTCHWHNWKFDLQTGKSLNGDDRLRTYPVEIRDGDIWLDLKEPSREIVQANLVRQVLNALPERQLGRMVRLLARAHFEEIPVENLIAPAIMWTHDRLKYGFTHAIGAIPSWLALADQTDDLTLKMTFYAEIFDHLAFDGARYPQAPYPFEEALETFDATALKNALLDEDEATSVALANGFFKDGGTYEELLPLLVDIATEHYFDFGHSLIYLKKIRLLLQRLPQTSELALAMVRAWIRQTVNATREDVLPDFRTYAKTLQRVNALVEWGEGHNQPLMPRGLNIKTALEWTSQAMVTHTPRHVLQALIHAAADNMLHFDARHETAWDIGVKHNIGWLDFTHALTMANALGELAGDDDRIWRKGLLQIAMFVGRNAAYVDFDQDMSRWFQMADTPSEVTVEAIAHHGMGLNILACHLAKTYVAVSDEATKAQPETATLLCASVQRLLHARMEERHFRRTARQALDLVGKDYVTHE